MDDDQVSSHEYRCAVIRTDRGPSFEQVALIRPGKAYVNGIEMPLEFDAIRLIEGPDGVFERADGGPMPFRVVRAQQ